jgi:4-methylaminobutanoate oxidase (formaldehyde-forming)
MFTLEDGEPLLLGDEPIWRDGALVGRITSGAYGHTLGRSIGMGYVAHADGVDGAYVESGRWQLEIAMERFAARAKLEPPYDPKSTRVRG